MKKRTEFATRILISGAALLILSAAFLTGCDPDGDGGIFPSRYNYDFTEEEAMEINLGVYRT